MSIPSGADPETMNSSFVGGDGAAEDAAAGADVGADSDAATVLLPGEAPLPVEWPADKALMTIPATTTAPTPASTLRTQCEPLRSRERCPAGCGWPPGPGPAPNAAAAGGGTGIGCVCGVHAVPSHQRRTCWPPGSRYHPGCGWRGSCGGCAPDGPYCSPACGCWPCWPSGFHGGWLTVSLPCAAPVPRSRGEDAAKAAAVHDGANLTPCRDQAVSGTRLPAAHDKITDRPHDQIRLVELQVVTAVFRMDMHAV